MILVHNKNKFNKEELEWAIALIEAEYSVKERNTPHLMAALIEQDFDIRCTEYDILFHYNIQEDYEKQSNWISAGYSDTYGEVEEFGTFN